MSDPKDKPLDNQLAGRSENIYVARIYQLILEELANGSSDQFIGVSSSGVVKTLSSSSTNDPNAIHDNVASEINSISAKGSIVDNDEFIIEDSADSYNKKKSLFSTIKSTLKTYFDTIYPTTALVPHSSSPIDCSTNPNYPSASEGEYLIVSVAGKIGGASGEEVEAGDLIICATDSSGGDEATVGSEFIVVQNNINDATDIPTDTSNFDNNLSSADDTVQKALDTLDELSAGSSNYTVNVETLTASKTLDETGDKVQIYSGTSSQIITLSGSFTVGQTFIFINGNAYDDNTQYTVTDSSTNWHLVPDCNILELIYTSSGWKLLRNTQYGRNVIIPPVGQNNNQYDDAITIGNGQGANYDGGIGIGDGSGVNFTGGVGIGRNSAQNYSYGVGIGYGGVYNNNDGIGIGHNASNNFNYGVGIGYYTSGNDYYGIGIGRSASYNDDRAIGIGYYAENNETYSIGIQAYSKAERYKELRWEGMENGTPRKGGLSIFNYYPVQYTGTAWSELFLTGTGSNRLDIKSDSALQFRCQVVARTTGGGNMNSAWELTGLITQAGIVGSVNKTLIAQDSGASGWDVQITYDVTNTSLKLEFTGGATNTDTIRVHAIIYGNEVVY